jgi:hypothetical protein
LLNVLPILILKMEVFSGWTCYTGNTVALGNSTNAINLFPSGGPVPNYHTMYSAANDAGTLDFYGGFPVMCPNGSGYSVKLGNTMGGAGSRRYLL